ncbi:multidrug transporter subunit MdtO [Serratia marcescens]|nr:multidrug transporter subunit MdtO [Serratia marcescens]
MSELTTFRTKKKSMFNFLKHELHAFPGRYNAMLRYLISSVIVIVISLTLNVPMLSYSILVIFFGTQQNTVLTHLVFPFLVIAQSLAVGFAIFILKFTIDYPIIRLLFTAVTLMLLLYWMRSSKKMGPLLFMVAITVTYAQSFVDQTPNGESLLRNLLWMWVAGGYALVVTYIVNMLILPVEPVKQLKHEIERILTVVSYMLDVTASGKPVRILKLEEIQDSILTLHKLLKFSVMRDTRYRDSEGYYLSQITTVEQLYSASRDLHDMSTEPLSIAVISHCNKLSKECQIFLQNILKDETYHLPLQGHEQILELPSCLREMYSALLNLSLLKVHNENKLAPLESITPVRCLPTISYDYIKFSLKTTLSVAFCYVFYTSVQWSGIHTSMLTCIIVALPSIGAVIQKSLLRFSGCLVGSVIALLVTVFIMPQLDSITSLLILVTPVIALSGWVAAGSERSSYAGIQIAFAFSLAMFTDFSPSPQLPEIRDRIIGIILGIVVSTLAQILLWPERESKNLLKSLAGLFSYFSEKMSLRALNQNAHNVGWIKLDSAQKLLAQVELEPSWHSDDNGLLILRCQIVLNKLRELQITLSRLENEYASAVDNNLKSRSFFLIEQILQELASGMAAYGEGLLNEPVISVSIGGKLNPEIQVQWNEFANNSLASWEHSLLIQVEEIMSICFSIPVWNKDGETISAK